MLNTKNFNMLNWSKWRNATLCRLHFNNGRYPWRARRGFYFLSPKSYCHNSHLYYCHCWKKPFNLHVQNTISFQVIRILNKSLFYTSEKNAQILWHCIDTSLHPHCFIKFDFSTLSWIIQKFSSAKANCCIIPFSVLLYLRIFQCSPISWHVKACNRIKV